jgi:purine-binding chemotaxis protein CheW
MTLDNMIDDSYVLFELDGTTYALRSSDVQQLEMIEHITPVPNAAAAVEGIVFSRGQVIPAVSVRARFGLPKAEHDLRSRLIVVRAGDRNIGLIVDSAREFKRIAADAIKPPPDSLSGTTGKYLEGIASIDDKLILVLNLDEVIRTAEEISAEIEGQ